MSDTGSAAAAGVLEQRAEDARRAGGQQVAARAFGAAAAAATTVSERARLRIRQTHCLINLGDHPPAEQIALDVLMDREDLDPVVVADALVVVSQVRRRQGALTASMEALADALAYVERGSRRHADFARVMHNVAVGHSRAGLWHRALTLFERSVELSTPGREPLTLATMASAHVDIAIASPDALGSQNDHIATAAGLTARVLRFPDRDQIATALARANDAVCLLWTGRLAEAEQQAHRALADTERETPDLEIVRASYVLGETALRASHWGTAIERLRRCLDLSTSSGIESFPPRAYRRLASVHYQHGDLDALMQTTVEMAEWFERRIASERSDRVAHVELGVRHRLVEALSLEDPLTKLPNRRFLDRWLPRALEAGHRVAVAIIDLDDFKVVNDLMSYEVGDRVLSEFAEILRSDTRRGDVAARLGGDEFIVVINTQSLDTARQALERLRARVEEHPWSQFSGGPTVTMSAGVAMAEGGDSAASMRSASAALQVAKRSGRNQVVIAE